MVNKEKIKEGAEVLVDTSDYGLEGEHWCEVSRDPLWYTHSPYPVAAFVEGMSEDEVGIFSLRDVKDVR